MKVDLLPQSDQLLLIKPFVALAVGLTTKLFNKDLDLLWNREHANIVRVDSWACSTLPSTPRLVGCIVVIHGSCALRCSHFNVTSLEKRFLYELHNVQSIFSRDYAPELKFGSGLAKTNE